jgi:sn-glycerol 3-phosphate transport system substrate-binding protein
MMKKILVILAVLFLAAGASAKEIELSFWFSSGFNAKRYIEDTVAEYNALMTGVKVKPVFQGLYQEMEVKMLTAAVTGQLPDVAQEKFEYMDLYIEEDLLEPVDSEISEYDKQDIFKEMWQAVTRNGRVYGVPFCVNTEIFFYNADIFKEESLDPEASLASWEDVVETGIKLTRDKDEDGNIDRFALMFWQNGFHSFAPLLWDHGGRLFNEDGTEVNVNSDEMLRTISFIQDLVYKHGIMPHNWTNFEGAQAFLTGKIAMGPFISGGLVYFEENLPWTLKVTPYPSLHEERYSALTGLALVNFSTNKKKRKAANDFIIWLVSKKNTTDLFKEVGYLPVRKSAYNSLEIRSFVRENPNFKVALEELKHSRALPYQKEYFKINEILIGMIERVILTNSDVFIELKKAENEITAILQ